MKRIRIAVVSSALALSLVGPGAFAQSATSTADTTSTSSGITSGSRLGMISQETQSEIKTLRKEMENIIQGVRSDYNQRIHTLKLSLESATSSATSTINLDVRNQIKAIRKEMNDKIGTIRKDYQQKIDSLKHSRRLEKATVIQKMKNDKKEKGIEKGDRNNKKNRNTEKGR